VSRRCHKESRSREPLAVGEFFIAGPVAAGLLLLAPRAAAEDWPQFLGPNRDSTTTEAVSLWPPVELWRASIGNGHSSVTVAAGRVVAMGHVAGSGSFGTDTVYCFDLESGAALWTDSYQALSNQGNFGGTRTTLPDSVGEFGPRATPAADSSAVYTVSLNGEIRFLDAATGALLARKIAINDLGGEIKGYGFCSSPLLYQGRLLLDVGGACVALDRSTGDKLWRLEGGRGWWSVPSAVTGTVGWVDYVLFGGRDLVCANVDTGELLWTYTMMDQFDTREREASATPIPMGDRVLISTYPDTGRLSLLQIDASSAVETWGTSEVMTYHLSNVVQGGYAYAMDNARTEWAGNDAAVSSLKCIDLATGAVVWTEAGMGWANPILAAGELLILREVGELVHAEASPSGYVELGRAQVIDGITWTVPALADGRVLVRNYKGDLVCVYVGAKPAVSIEAADPLARETDDGGSFTVTRTGGGTASDLVVKLSVSAQDAAYDLTAGGGPVTSQVTIPSGETSVAVTVTPLADADSADGRVELSVEADAAYVRVMPAAATVHVVDASTPIPTVTVESAGADHWALEGGPDEGAFRLTASPSLGWPVIVGFSVGGTAGPGDYELEGAVRGTVAIPADGAAGAITVRALDDADDLDEEVTVTLLGGSAYYSVGMPDSATVVLVDDDGPLTDSDGDGMDDGWERSYWGDTSQTGAADADSDGLSNADEHTRALDPTDADTDGDGYKDGVEVASGSDPLDPASQPEGPPPEEEPWGTGGTWCASGTGAGASTAAALVLLVSVLAAARSVSRRALGGRARGEGRDASRRHR
jgi:hypothetical protein